MTLFIRELQLILSGILPVDTGLPAVRTLIANPPPGTVHYEDLFDPDVQRWNNVSFADNYYQKLGSAVFTLTPNGRSLFGVADIDVPLSGAGNIPARAGFIQGVGNKADQFGIAVPGIGGPHSRVWRWYAGTIDLGLSQFEVGTKGEPLFRSLDDGSLAFPFGSLDVPYYTAHEYVRPGVSPFQFGSAEAVWEGIGTGWAFSPSGGVLFQGSTIPGLDPRLIDNADDTVKQVVNPFGVVVESVFNGTFEHGNIHRGQRFPSNEVETPGWSLHGGSFQSDLASLSTFTVHNDGTGNYVAELNSSLELTNSQITHNRFYIPETAQSLEFFARVKDKEIFRTGRLTASISLDGDNFQSIGSFDLTSTSSQYAPHTFALNNTLLGNVSGKMGYIRFELTHPGAGSQSGIDRVYIDNVRLLGVGLPLQTESVGVMTSNASPQVAQADITSLIETARLQWQGLVKAPDGIVGVALGQVGITATDFSLDKVAGTRTGDSEKNGDTRSSEGSFNDQLFFTNANTVIILASMDQQSTSNKIGLNDNAPFTSDSHTVNSRQNASLSEGESTSFLASVVNENGSMEAGVDEHGSTIGDCPIGIADFNISADLSAPSGKRATVEFDLLNFEKLSFVPFMQLPPVLGHGNQIVSSPPSSMLHSAWVKVRASKIKIKMRFNIIVSPSVA